MLTAWGETTVFPEQSFTIGGGLNSVSASVNIFQGAISVRIYYGSAAGQEFQYEQFSVVSNPVIGTLANIPISGAPPVRNSAFLPDTDGGFVSSYTMFRWLNDALKAAARITGGIQDTCGIASVSGMRRYVSPGQWLRFDQCFYDGWELDLGNKAETFRNRNLTANIAISLMVDAQSDTTRIELYWTPSRTSGKTTTSGTLLANDQNVNINPATGWLLADGFVQVGAEIMSYSAITG